MTILKHKEPCRFCPFNRHSLGGYLGNDTPSGFLWSTQREAHMPCHIDIDYEAPDWEDQLKDAAHCAGSLIFLKNSCTLPVDKSLREMMEQVETDNNIFTWGKEFLDHHSKVQ